MSNLNTKTLMLKAGEKCERVWLNEEDLDLHIVQEEKSELKLHVLYLSPKAKSKSKIVVEQAGEGCKTELYALAFLHGEQEAALHTNVRHNIGGGSSKQVLKFVLDDKSKGAFLGELYIAPDAQKTDAQQTNRNLLLSDEATMRTMPQLEIYADDVKATHGASTGQLDESALFYMQQRCLGKQEARELLINAFMQDIIATISDEAVREEMSNRLLSNEE